MNGTTDTSMSPERRLLEAIFSPGEEHFRIQLSNTASGEYDVNKPLPYPYSIDAGGDVCRQDYWRGEPKRLVGFQNDADVQEVNTLVETYLEALDMGTPIDVVGKYPVFMDANGTFWNATYPIDSVVIR